MAIREWMNSSGGRTTSAVVSVALVLGAGYLVWAQFKPSEAELDARTRWFVDRDTGKAFRVELEDGMSFPVEAPSGKMTGYPAEACYWTADGKAKTEPTYVIVREDYGESGPTFCPDCKRLVRGHNPRPGEGVEPPPTEADYRARSGR